MPEENYVWLPRQSILTFEELSRLARIFGGLGASKVRITGGEPLLRHELHRLVSQVRAIPEIEDIALTTNGLLLARHAGELKTAGLDRITVSLDTLRPDRMEQSSRTPHHADILEGIDAARAAGFTGTKINSVVIRGFNDDEIVDLVEFGRQRDVEVRFIEYMDVGGATHWSMREVVSQREILAILERRYGAITPVAGRAAAPAERFTLSDGTRFGIIASTTAPFCRDCDRSRVTADGTWFLCLYSESGLDLRELLRSGASDAEIGRLIRETWSRRDDRGAERRSDVAERGALYQLESLRADPRREMHTRGG
jgi:cyclic pyranopterin phosphate synthase